MTVFLASIALLIAGYFIYGLVVERIVGIDSSRLMPSQTRRDGVDFIPMATWRVFLIQFLNIAGLGPIFGAIMGVMFGPAAFLWIVFGTIFAGAVHDFVSAMMSVRSGGESLPELVGRELGPAMRQIMRVVSVLLLVLVGAVFIVTPADLLAGMTPGWADATFWIIVIFAYYALATLLPVDRLIGRLYPIFGAALLFMALGLTGYLLFGGVEIPVDLAGGLGSRYADAAAHPVFPMMFVSIACGAISGFHATQSPMMARCLKNEKLARPVFYGAMVAEGLVALVWAAAAIAFTGGYEGLQSYMAAHSGAGSLVREISIAWLGAAGGVLAILGVVAAPITTGDTALRSARLIIADMLSFDQKSIVRRLIVTLPLFAAAFGLMMIDFSILWRYFAWTNQVLATITLWACTVWLARRGRFFYVCLLPAMFMTAVVTAYFFYAPSPEGLGLPMAVAAGIALAAVAVATALFGRYLHLLRSGRKLRDPGC